MDSIQPMMKYPFSLRLNRPNRRLLLQPKQKRLPRRLEAASLKDWEPHPSETGSRIPQRPSKTGRRILKDWEPHSPKTLKDWETHPQRLGAASLTDWEPHPSDSKWPVHVRQLEKNSGAIKLC